MMVNCLYDLDRIEAHHEVPSVERWRIGSDVAALNRRNHPGDTHASFPALDPRRAALVLAGLAALGAAPWRLGRGRLARKPVTIVVPSAGGGNRRLRAARCSR